MNASIAKTLLAFRGMVSLNNYHTSTIKTELNNDLIFAMIADISQLGYTFSPTLIDYLKKFSKKDLTSFYNDTLALLKNAVGADVKYAPLFRKFPESTPNRSFVIETIGSVFGDYFHPLYYVIYYTWNSDEYNGDWFGRQFVGVSVEEALLRPELVTTKQLKVLNLASEADLNDLFTNLVGAKGSISEDNKSFVKDMIVNYSTDLESHLPKEIPNKENFAYLIACVYERYGFTAEIKKIFLPYMKTATDILRVATGLSGGDVSLAEHSKFKLSNSQRKFILEALDNLNYATATEDMLRFHGLWLVLAKYLHVAAYGDRYPHAAKMVDAIRNSASDIQTFNKIVEAYLIHPKLDDAKNFANFLKIVTLRPGDFARRLDHILRSTKLKDKVVSRFLSVADKIATPLLLNLAVHFAHRNEPAKVRVFCPKGSTTHAIVQNGETRDLLDDKLTAKLSNGINKLLIDRYATKDSLGKVFIDPALSDILVPTSMRDASSSLQVAARGSKFKISDDTSVVRLFLYWEDQKTSDSYNRVDIDLSCQMLGENFANRGVVSFYNLNEYGITHSGDFTSAPNGASEFIDIDIKATLKANKGVRYIAVTVNSYTGQAFNSIVAKGGYMVRDGKTGKSFEAKTVEQKYDITAGTKFAIPMVLDLLERKVIWLDLGMHDAARTGTNIGHKGADLSVLTQYATEMYREKASLFDLFNLHAKARATSVTTEFNKDEKYDTIFDSSFALKIDDIMANYL